MTNETKQENTTFIRQDCGEQIARPPVVVVMGHVDHGKSSLLEAIREDFVICAKESGGITQHIGAYEVTIPSEKALSSRDRYLADEGSHLAEIPRAEGARDDFASEGRKITFIDTPGHEAFSAMRQRGAKVADIAVLVVDACEGVKAQTKEAINFIKKAGASMIVALNKIDKPQAQPEKVKSELAEVDVLVESLGGKIPSVNVSAKAKTGIDELLDAILLTAEMEELKADLGKPAEGTIIESLLHSQKGPFAAIILEQGILKRNDIIGTSSAVGKIKCLNDFRGKSIVNVKPSQPASVLGFESPPGIGEKFKVYDNIELARAALKEKSGECLLPQVIPVEQGVKILNMILKTDVLGSCEAIEGILKDLPQEKVILRILKAEVGDIAVSDIQLAENGKAKIFGFRVKAQETTQGFARNKGVKIRLFDVVYDLVQEVRQIMTNILEPEIARIDLGKFKVAVLFKKGKDNQIIGGKVLEGEITKNTFTEIIREETIIGKGRIKNIQEEKKDIGKAVKGKEIAILFQGNTKIEEGDILAVYREEKSKGIL